MTVCHRHVRLFSLLLALLICGAGHAQTPGSIITASTLANNPMNPNGDGYVTSHNAAFSGPLDETQFELPFVPLFQYEPEPASDNQLAGGCSILELESDPVKGAESAYYYYEDADGIPGNSDDVIVFRFRIAKYSNGATGFSILIDTDNKFGPSGPVPDPNAIAGNPGFEREVNLYNSPGGDGRVKVFNVDGASTTPTTPMSSYSKNTHHQVAKALNYSLCSEVIFVDMFIPFADLGISASTPLRMAAAVNEDLGTALGGGAGDVAGIDGDDPAMYNDDNQFLTAILGQSAAPVQPNSAPVASDATVSLMENSSIGILVHNVVASDASALTYTIIGGNTGSAFAINNSSGAITVNSPGPLNFETNPVFTVIVRVSDGSLFDDATVTVNLNNLNEAPAAADAFASLDENKINGTIVYGVIASDPDASSSLTYSITGGNISGAFAINSASGQISVSNSSALNFETNPVFILSVTVSDGVLSDDATITVNLNNVNESPLASDASVTLDENKINGSPVHTLAASDPDASTSLTFFITSGNTGTAFAINSTSGVISVNNSSSLDFETTPTFNLTIRVSDGALYDDAAITVNLNDVMETVMATDAFVTLEENKSSGSFVHKVVANGPENSVLSYSITAGNTGEAFAINSITGELSVNNSTALDYETTLNFVLTVRVDGGTLYDQATIAISLANVNEAPSAANATVEVNEIEKGGTLVHTVTGSDPDAATTLQYTITGGNVNTAFAIDVNSGAITVSNDAALDYESLPAFSLTVRVSDGYLFQNVIVRVNLKDVNEPPVINEEMVTIEAGLTNGTQVHRIDASDPDTGDVLAFFIESGNVNSVFSIDPETGEIFVNDGSQLQYVITPSYDLVVRAEDGKGLSSSAIITINLSPPEPSSIFPEKGFSPNGDGINDFWLIRGIEAYPQNEVKVFNRWGILVFETQSYDNVQVIWKGQPASDQSVVPETTYYFVIRIPSKSLITGYVVMKK